MKFLILNLSAGAMAKADYPIPNLSASANILELESKDGALHETHSIQIAR